jgi:uncharacterized protein YjbI with pentapeptide repeats
MTQEPLDLIPPPTKSPPFEGKLYSEAWWQRVAPQLTPDGRALVQKTLMDAADRLGEAKATAKQIKNADKSILISVHLPIAANKLLLIKEQQAKERAKFEQTLQDLKEPSKEQLAFLADPKRGFEQLKLTESGQRDLSNILICHPEPETGKRIDCSNLVFLHVTFRGAVFVGEAFFWRATFAGETNFPHTTFIGRAFFGGAQFDGKANFWNAKFEGETNFWNAKFEGEASFLTARFGGEASFKDAEFTNKAIFAESTFTGIANFYAARFNKTVAFRGSKWGAVPDFVGTAFKDGMAIADLKNLQYGLTKKKISWRADPVPVAELNKILAMPNESTSIYDSIFIFCIFFNIFFQILLFAYRHFQAYSLSILLDFTFKIIFSLSIIQFFYYYKCISSTKAIVVPLEQDRARKRAVIGTILLVSATVILIIRALYDHLSLNNAPHLIFLLGFLLCISFIRRFDPKDIPTTYYRPAPITDRLQALRKMAHDADDRPRELDYFALELQSRYQAKKKPVAEGDDTSQETEDGNINRHSEQERGWLWLKRQLIALYGLFSDYGRGILRPICWLLVLWAGCALGYARLAVVWTDVSIREYLATLLSQSSGNAMLLSLVNALPALGVASEARKSSLEALYGCVECVPAVVHVIGVVEGVAAILLLFLIGLGLRNRFRL